MKTILLYNPKEKRKIVVPHIPLSLLAIGSVLKNKFKVVIIDGRLSSHPEKIIEEHMRNCLFLGITCMTGTPILDALRMAGKVRSLNPNLPIIWGGFHPTLLPEQTTAHPLVDIVVRGQGEETVKELAEALETNASLDKIKGIAYKKNGTIILTPVRPMKDVNEFPSLDYSLIDVEKYIKNDAATRTIDYLSSRGCPHHCGFCCIKEVYGQKWYAYPAERVVDEIEELINRYNVNGIHFMDDNFFVDVRRVKETCDEIIKRNLNFRWWAMCRSDYLVKFKEEFFLKLKKAGLEILNIGAESGSQRILNTIDKGITVETILNSAEKCRRYGFKGQFSFMMGFPFEEKEDLSMTMNVMDRIHCLDSTIDMSMFIYAPMPKTPLFEKCQKKGLNIYGELEKWGESYDYEEAITPWITKEQAELLETLSHLSWFAFTPSMEKKLNSLQKIVYKIFSKNAKFRWRFRFFRYPYEWKLLRILIRGVSIE